MMMMIDDDRFTVFVYYYPYYTPKKQTNNQPTFFFLSIHKRKKTRHATSVKEGAKTSWDFKKESKRGQETNIKNLQWLYSWGEEKWNTREVQEKQEEEEETI